MNFFLPAYLLSLLVVPHLLLAGKRPVSTLAWLWAILLFPYLGAIAYLFIGTDHIRRRTLRRRRFSAKPIPETLLRRGITEGEVPLLRGLSVINQIPLSSVSHVRVLVDARTFYPALLERIESAEHHIHIEFFIWRGDGEGARFLAALTQAANRGVEVRLLLDQMGCFMLKADFFKPLVDAGGKFSWFYSLPLNRHLRFVNLRNHRKLQIIDGQSAFVGGMNLGKEYLGEADWPKVWRDIQVEVEGSAVDLLHDVFATDWHFATGEKLQSEKYCRRKKAGPHPCQIIAGGPDLPREPVPKSLVSILNSATKRVWISTGYFLPDTLLLSALQICGSRGVDVRLIISKVTDHPWLLQVGRSFYPDILKFGVRVYEYDKGVNHAKTVLMDEGWFSIGSANFDNRSMRLNFELNLFIHCPAEAGVVEAMMLEDFSKSHEITYDPGRKISFLQRLGEAALRPLAPLL